LEINQTRRVKEREKERHVKDEELISRRNKQIVLTKLEKHALLRTVGSAKECVRQERG
jgi:hypothetical protein